MKGRARFFGNGIPREKKRKKKLRSRGRADRITIGMKISRHVQKREGREGRTNRRGKVADGAPGGGLRSRKQQKRRKARKRIETNDAKAHKKRDGGEEKKLHSVLTDGRKEAEPETIIPRKLTSTKSVLGGRLKVRRERGKYGGENTNGKRTERLTTKSKSQLEAKSKREGN